MKTIPLMSLILLSLGLIHTGAIRGDDQRPRRQRQFNIERFDTNGDGKISRQEFPRPEFFDRLDADGDGFITQAEIDQMRGQRGNRPTLGMNLRRALDADSDGKVSREEFAAIVEFFDQLDQDGDGALSSNELTRLASVRQSKNGLDVASLFEQYDADHDGKLSEEEMSASPQFKNPRFFGLLDKDQDGFITKQEMTAFVQQYRQKPSKH